MLREWLQLLEGSDAAQAVDDFSVPVAAPAGSPACTVQVVVPVIRQATKKRSFNKRAKALAMVVLSDDEVEEVEKEVGKSATVLEKERATPVVTKTSVSYFEGL